MTTLLQTDAPPTQTAELPHHSVHATRSVSIHAIKLTVGGMAPEVVVGLSIVPGSFLALLFHGSLMWIAFAFLPFSISAYYLMKAFQSPRITISFTGEKFTLVDRGKVHSISLSDVEDLTLFHLGINYLLQLRYKGDSHNYRFWPTGSDRATRRSFHDAIFPITPEGRQQAAQDVYAAMPKAAKKQLPKARSSWTLRLVNFIYLCGGALMVLTAFGNAFGKHPTSGPWVLGGGGLYCLYLIGRSIQSRIRRKRLGA